MSLSTARVFVFGAIAEAMGSNFDLLAGVLDDLLIERWRVLPSAVIVIDSLDPHASDMVRRYAELRRATFTRIEGKWRDYGAAAASVRDGAAIAAATHAIGFFVGSDESTLRLFRRCHRANLAVALEGWRPQKAAALPRSHSS